MGRRLATSSLSKTTAKTNKKTDIHVSRQQKQSPGSIPEGGETPLHRDGSKHPYRCPVCLAIPRFNAFGSRLATSSVSKTTAKTNRKQTFKVSCVYVLNIFSRIPVAQPYEYGVRVGPNPNTSEADWPLPPCRNNYQPKQTGVNTG